MSTKTITINYPVRPRKPPIEFDPTNIPRRLRKLKRWIVWMYVRASKTPKGFRKIPIGPKTLTKASAMDSRIWLTFEEALALYEACPGLAGLGLVLADDEDIIVVDIDHCISSDRHFTLESKRIIRSLKTYTEVSPSGDGVKCYCIGKKPGPNCNRSGSPIEMYAEKRFVAVTGHVVSDRYSEIRDCQTEIDDLYDEFLQSGADEDGPETECDRVSHFDDDVAIERACSNRKSGENITALFVKGDISGYDSQSEAEMALAMHLAFWCNGDLAQMKRLMFRSALARDKYKQNKGYLDLTLGKAIQRCTEFCSPSGGSAPSELDQELSAFDLTDLGNSKRLLKRFGHDIRVCTDTGEFFFWTEDHWALDVKARRAREAAKMVAVAMNREFECLPESDETKELRKAFFAHTRKSQNRRSLENMVELAKTDPQVAVGIDEWNPNTWRINLLNGTLDARTSTLQNHSRDDLITTVSKFEFDPEADCPTFETFIKVIFPDRNLRRYVQRVCGYCLTGDTREECFFLLWGTGRNGKSTLLDVLAMVLSGYHVKARPETFIEKRDVENVNHLAQIARLAGKRLATVSETQESARLNEHLIKELTGRDEVTAREFYQGFFQFRPQVKIIIGTNCKPEITGANLGIWRRVRMVPFLVTIPEDEVDLQLREKLRRELPGILNWMLEGCSKWLESGLNEPEIVREATNEYQVDQDRVGLYLSERTVPNKKSRVSATDLFQDHIEWLKCRNERRLPSQKMFGEQVKAHGIEARKSNIVYYLGVELVNPTDADLDEAERRAGGAN